MHAPDLVEAGSKGRVVGVSSPEFKDAPSGIELKFLIDRHVEKVGIACLESDGAIVHLSTELNKANSHIAHLKDVIRKREQTLDFAEDAFVRLKSDVSAKERALKQKEQEYLQAQGAVVKSKAEVEKLSKQLAATEQARASASTRSAEQSARITQLEQKVREWEAYAKHLKDQTPKITQLQTDIQSIKDGAIKALQEQKDSFKRGLQKLEEECKQVSSRGFFKTAVAWTASWTGVCESTGQVIQEIQAQCRATQQTIAKLDREIGCIRAGKFDSLPGASEIYRSLQRSLLEKQTSLAQMQSEAAKIPQAESELKVLNQQLSVQLASAQKDKTALSREIDRLKSTLLQKEQQLARRRQGRDTVVARYHTLTRELQTTKAELASKQAEVERLTKENDSLTTQLVAKEKEVDGLKKSMQDSITAMAKNITGETQQVALGQLKSLLTAIETLPTGLAPATIEVCTKFWGSGVVALTQLKDNIAKIEEEVILAPGRRRQEFETQLEGVVRFALSGGQYLPENEAQLLRFCKLGVDRSVEPTISYDQSTDQFKSVVAQITTRAFQVLAEQRPGIASKIDQVREQVITDFDNWLNLPTLISAPATTYVPGASSIYTGYFNKLNELIHAAAIRLGAAA